MDAKPKSFTYRTAVRWTDAKKGQATSAGKPGVQVATPPEFKGHEGIWSPEDLFVTSINACVMSTFLAFAERAGLAFAGYESEAEGTLEMVEGKLQFTTVVIRPKVTLKPGGDAAKAKELIEKAEANCLISNSVKSKVTMEATIV